MYIEVSLCRKQKSEHLLIFSKDRQIKESITFAEFGLVTVDLTAGLITAMATAFVLMHRKFKSLN